MKPHKHAAVIKAWADGNVIEFRSAHTQKKWVRIDIPMWESGSEYRASIAEVEGKPVFVGDVLYGDKGGVYTATLNLNFDPKRGETLSWNPPSKTITVTIPRPLNPDGIETKVPIIYINCTEGVLLKYETKADADAAMKAIMEAMNEPRP